MHYFKTEKAPDNINLPLVSDAGYLLLSGCLYRFFDVSLTEAFEFSAFITDEDVTGGMGTLFDVTQILFSEFEALMLCQK